MMRALSTAGTGMIAQQFNLDTIANNLANVNTTAFKQQRAEFQDLVYQNLGASGGNAAGDAKYTRAIQVGMGSKFSASAVSFATGAPINVSDPLNMMINGDGFFQIQGPDGGTLYSRDGTFTIDGNRNLVTSMGFLVQPSIQIPEGATSVTVSQNGIVTAVLPGNSETSEIGRITIATFPNPAGLTREGNNIYRAGGASGEPTIVEPGQSGSGLILSGFVEGSNVQIVEEMVRMITAQRAYEINSKAVMTADEMLSTLNQLKR